MPFQLVKPANKLFYVKVRANYHFVYLNIIEL